MQRKRRGLIALWMACVLLLTTQPARVGADSGSEIGVKLYEGTEVLKPGSTVALPEGKDLQSGMALDANQTNLAALYGADLKDNCPDGYTRDGWRMWTDSSGLVASRWIGDTDANWADYMTGYFDYNSNTILAPNWVPEYSAGNVDGSAAVIKKTEDGSTLVKGDTVTGGSVGADGSVTADGTTFHFQWLREYKIVQNPTKENEIKGSVLETGDSYNESTGQWIKDDESVSTLMGIECELKPGDVVVVKDLGSDSSAWQYYFNGYLWNDSTFLRTYFVTDDKENKVFYATVPSTEGNFQLWLGNANKIEEVSASISVFRADSTVTGQTGAVYTGAAGNYCCQISYEKDVDDGNGGTEKKTFMLLSDSVTVPEKQEEYKITKACGGNGVCGIEVDGEEIFGEPIMAAAGQTVTIKAVPANGYEEGTISVKKTGVETAPELSLSTTEDENGNKIRTFTMPDYPVTVSVDFKQKAPKTYTVTLPEGEGYIAAAKNSSSSPVVEGGNYSFTVTVASGYEATDNFKVKANGIELTAEAGSTYTYVIRNITSNQVITVEGVGVAVIDTTAPVISGIEDEKEYYGAVTFKVEDNVALEAVWVDENQVVLSQESTYTIQPDNCSHTIVAKDTANNMVSCTISVYEEWVRAGIINICGENGDCSIEIDGKEVTGSTIRVVPGQTVAIKAVPNADYEEDEVSVRKTGVVTAPDESFTITEDENGNKIRTFTMPDYPVTVSVNFKQKAPKTYMVTLPEGAGYIAAAKDSSSSPVVEGGSYSFTVTVASGYEATDKFKVKANGIELKAEAGSAYTYVINNITSNQVITVEGVDVAVIDTTAPVISGIEDGKEYYGAVTFKVEDNVALEAVWVDENQVALSQESTYTIQPDNCSHTIVAKDTAGNTVSCTVEVYEEWVRAGIINICGDNGACSIEVDGKEVTGSTIRAVPGQTVTVKAVPNADYEESEVSVRKTGMPTAPDVSCTTTEDENGNKVRTFTMPDYPVTVSVSFKQKAPKTYTVTLPEGEGYIAETKDGFLSPVVEGGSYAFTVTIGSGYEVTDNFKVKANGIELTAEAGSTYTYVISDITSDQVITVEGVGVAVIDTEAPVISGIEDGKEYYGAVTFKVEDVSLDMVQVDGNEVQPDSNGTYMIQPDNESHTIVAKDTAGNTVSCTIMVYETWVRDGITKNGDYQLKIGIAYKLGSGNWKVSGDDTVYVGGNAFYVPITKGYTLFLQSGVQSGARKSLGRTCLKQ